CSLHHLRPFPARTEIQQARPAVVRARQPHWRVAAESYFFKSSPTDFVASPASAVLIFPARSSTVFCCSGVSFKLASCLRVFAASAYFVLATSLVAWSINPCAFSLSVAAAVWSFAACTCSWAWVLSLSASLTTCSFACCTC